ncbi:MAG TPA: FecR domain-containing protein [Balneolales bacterium]|nr:FecR domain-containing protein [Balneolales bacterium]
MNNYDQKIWTLITRVLSNEANSVELREFHKWLAEDPKHEESFIELKSVWEEEPRENSVDSAYLFDYNKGLNKLRDKLREDETPVSSDDNAGYNLRDKKGMPGIAPLRPDRERAVPTFSNNISTWKIAASILVLIFATTVFIKVEYWKPETTIYLTKDNEQRIITLPDGSRVRLNKDSKIEFQKGLKGKIREIDLSGEAFFEVKHDADRPFIIHAGPAVIRDVGTSFNVKEAREGRVVVAVKDGIVSLRNDKMQSGAAAILHKNHVGVLTKNDSVRIEQMNVDNYLSWINRRLVFKEMPFKEVVSQLENIYGIDCQLKDPSLDALKLTAYTENPSLNEVLNMISLTLQIKYRETGNTVIWMRK